MTSKETVARVAEMVAKDSRKNWSWIKHGGFLFTLMSAIVASAMAHGRAQQKSMDMCETVGDNTDQIEIVEKEVEVIESSFARAADGIERIEVNMVVQRLEFREDMKELRVEIATIRNSE